MLIKIQNYKAMKVIDLENILFIIFISYYLFSLLLIENKL
jgi:hypothetical protein